MGKAFSPSLVEPRYCEGCEQKFKNVRTIRLAGPKCQAEKYVCPFTIPAGWRVSFSIKFVPKMNGTAYGKIFFNGSAAANSPVVEAPHGYGSSISACCFTFLES